MIFLSIGFTLIVTAIYLYFSAPIYQATTKVIIESTPPNSNSIEQILAGISKEEQLLATQYALFESRSLIKKVLQELNLLESEEFQASLSPVDLEAIKAPFKPIMERIEPVLDQVKSTLKLDGIEIEEKSNLDPYSPLIDDFLKRLNIELLSKSTLVSIHFQGSSPELTAQIVNSLVDVHIREQEAYQRTLGEGAKKWLGVEAKKLKQRVNKSKSKIQNFVKNKNMIELDKDRQFANQQYRETLTEIARIETEKFKLKSLIEQIESSKASPEKLLSSIPKSLINKTIQKLMETYQSEKINYSNLSKVIRPSHPDLIASEEKIKSIEARMPMEILGIQKSLEGDFRAAVAQEKAIRKRQEKQKREIMDLDKNILQFKELQQEAESSNKLLYELKTQGDEYDVASRYYVPPIRIVDRAEVPSKPVKPQKAIALIMGLGIGGFLGLALIFFKEITDDTLKNKDDVDRQLPFFLLGSLGLYQRNGASLSKKLNSEIWEEEFRFLRNNLLFLLSKKPAKGKPQNVFMVTSATPGEGKLTVVSKLGVSLGQAGKKVIIIDADYLNPKICKAFGVKNKQGLISEDGKFNTEIVPIETDFPGVSVVPAGKCTHKNLISPDEIYATNFKKFLTDVKKTYDVVLIKAPPTLSLSHASAIERFCDGILFVIASGVSNRKTIHRAVGQLVSSPVEIKLGQFEDVEPKLLNQSVNGKSQKTFRVLLNKVKDNDERVFPYPYPGKYQ